MDLQSVYFQLKKINIKNLNDNFILKNPCYRGKIKENDASCINYETLFLTLRDITDMTQ